MTDFDGKKYVAVYDQFKVRQTIAITSNPINQMSMIAGDYEDEMILAEDQISKKMMTLIHLSN